MTDEDLMLAVRAGDLSRLAPLFERHHRALFDYLARMTGSRTVAEDLVQDVFARILKYRHTFRDDSRFETWAFRIARNVRADYFKGQRIRHTPLDQAADVAAGTTASPKPSSLVARRRSFAGRCCCARFSVS